jgi:hypothetical protein
LWPSGLQHHVVLWIDTNVAEEHAASGLRVEMNRLKMQLSCKQVVWKMVTQTHAREYKLKLTPDL